MMELILLAVFIGAALAFASVVFKNANPGRKQQDSFQHIYFYSKKDSLMTNAEWRFYDRLSRIVADYYYVFPQIHLSALLKNETKGKYYKLAYQRANRRSVDYVLCDKLTHKLVYAVELDDWSHDSQKRIARDDVVKQMLNSVGIPLVRFRGVEKLNDEEIITRFQNAKKFSQTHE